jgi:hypothetical protein
MSDLWHRGKRAIVYHAKRQEVHVNWNDDWLCGPMMQAWGDEQHAKELHEYLDVSRSRNFPIFNSRTPMKEL